MPAKECLPVFKSETSVHEDPFQVSVAALPVPGPGSPPNAIAAVERPPPDK